MDVLLVHDPLDPLELAPLTPIDRREQHIAFRLEGRSVVYIETSESTVLEMKQNFILQGGMSFFFPKMK